MNASIPYGTELRVAPNASSPIPKIGQIIRKNSPKNGIVKNVIIGTNLDPEKNPKIGGNSIVWNLLYKNATNNPTVIPPNTEVTIEVNPTLVPTTEAGTAS